MPSHVQDMVMVHRVFRRELRAIPELVRAVADGDRERAEVVGEHVNLVLDLLHHHHEAEDVQLWPVLAQRAPQHCRVFEEMDAEHEQLTTAIGRVRAAKTRWCATATLPLGEDLACAVETLAGQTVAHLDHEERAALPLCGELLSQEEWNRLGAHALAGLGLQKSLLVFAAMEEESPPAEWAAFVDLLPAPVRDAYESDGVAAYATYIARVRSNPVQADRTGVEGLGEVADRFFRAAERADVAAMRHLYAPHATIWHNDNKPEQTVEENLASLGLVFGGMRGLRFEVKRRVETAGGLFQTHVLHAVLRDGSPVNLDAAMFMAIENNRITRVEEYFDVALVTRMFEAAASVS